MSLRRGMDGGIEKTANRSRADGDKLIDRQQAAKRPCGCVGPILPESIDPELLRAIRRMALRFL